MKRITILILCVTLITSLIACDKSYTSAKLQSIGTNAFGVHDLLVTDIHTMFKVGDTIMFSNNPYGREYPYIVVSKDISE